MFEDFEFLDLIGGHPQIVGKFINIGFEAW